MNCAEVDCQGELCTCRKRGISADQLADELYWKFADMRASGEPVKRQHLAVL